MQSDNFNFSSLVQNLYNEDQLSEIEKCVVLFQMLTYVGNDLYDELLIPILVNAPEKKQNNL